MTLVERTNKLVADIDEMMTIAKRDMDFDSLKDMNGNEFELMKAAYRMIDEAKDLAVEQAKVLDEINQKLDRLLEAK